MNCYNKANFGQMDDFLVFYRLFLSHGELEYHAFRQSTLEMMSKSKVSISLKPCSMGLPPEQ